MNILCGSYTDRVYENYENFRFKLVKSKSFMLQIFKINVFTTHIEHIVHSFVTQNKCRPTYEWYEVNQSLYYYYYYYYY
jgi:hypothetical protein